MQLVSPIFSLYVSTSNVRGPAFMSSLLRKCIPRAAIQPGRQLHAQIVIQHLLPHTTLETDLLLVYCKSGDLGAARMVFNGIPQRNMHSWNILISAHVNNSFHKEALCIFNALLDEGLHPDGYTFPPLFKACSGMGDLYLGKMLHVSVLQLGFEDHVIVASSMLDMYAKCGSLNEASQLFSSMSLRDVVAWNSMISGFVRGGFSFDGLGLCRKMQLEKVKMDGMTVSSILTACGLEGDLMKGQEVHGQAVKNTSFSADTVINNSLLEMYSKCGSLHCSLNVFAGMSDRNQVTWTTMISCYGAHGRGKESLSLFNEMQAAGFLPNCVTLTAVLASCSHSGLIIEGKKIFRSMESEFGVHPTTEHYACMVDLLGRFGQLDEAMNLIVEMPLEPLASVWGALLGACRVHKNVELGEVSACRLFELEPRNSSNYVALCGIYEAAGRWDGVLSIRSRMRELGLAKMPGCSWIIVQGAVHKFYQADASDESMRHIYQVLNGLSKLM